MASILTIVIDVCATQTWTVPIFTACQFVSINTISFAPMPYKEGWLVSVLEGQPDDKTKVSYVELTMWSLFFIGRVYLSGTKGEAL